MKSSAQMAERPHICEAVPGVCHEPRSGSQVVVLQRGYVVVCHCQLVSGLNEEVVVDSTMLVVMDGSTDVAGYGHQVIKDLALEQAAMDHDHVHHLNHASHMEAAQAHNMGWAGAEMTMPSSGTSKRSYLEAAPRCASRS